MYDFEFKLTLDFQHIVIEKTPNEREYKRLVKYFKRPKKGAFMSPAVRHGFVDGDISFVKDAVYIPIGLWGELVKYLDDQRKTYKIDGLSAFIDSSIKEDDIMEFVNKLFEGTVIDNIRWYQYESIYKILKYRYSAQQISTAAGKTMISYAVAAYLKNNGTVGKDSKFLLIVPRKDLVVQTKEKFELYNNGMVSLNIMPLGDKYKFDEGKYNEADIIISTYQSLANLNPGVFKKVSVINVDEAHTAKTDTIRKVIKYSSPLKYRFGLSGTLMVHMHNAEYYQNLEQLGPIVMIYNPRNLIDDGFAPDVRIEQLTIEYDSYENDHRFDEYKKYKEQGEIYKESGRRGSDEALAYHKEIYKIERSLICSDTRRLDAIIDYLKKIDKKKNILVLFNDIKGEYGKMIAERMNEFKDTRYIDGGTKSLERSLYTEAIEEKNMNLVASFGTFSTGIDLKNVHYIVFAESYKSPILIGQSIGRGLRNHKSKKIINIIDIVDSMYKHTNKQAAERVAIYNKEKYSLTKKSIKL